MIKARVTVGARDTMILGLTQDNWDRLNTGQPIMFDGSILGLGMQVLILGGQSEEDIREDLRSLGLVPTIKPDPRA